MEFLTKIRKVLFEPSKFFTNLKKEKGIKEAFIYFALLSAVNTLLAAIVAHLGFIYFPNIFDIPNLYQLTNYGPQPDFVWFIGFYLFWLALSFVAAGLLHLWIKILGGKGDYTKTYQLYAYSRTPDRILGWIPFVGFLSWLYSLALIIIGTQKVHGVERKRAYLMYAIPIIVIATLIFLSVMLLGFLLGLLPLEYIP